MSSEHASQMDIITFITEFHFNLENWESPEGANAILAQALTYARALGQSLEKRREIEIVTDATDFIDRTLARLERGLILRPAEALITDSHLFVPYVFPQALRVLNAAGLLSDSGLKSLTLKALRNKGGWIDQSISAMLEEKTPPGILSRREEALAFLAYMADTLRENFSKTPATAMVYNVGRRAIIVNAKPETQRKVLTNLRDWYLPKENVTLEEAEHLFEIGGINEEPGTYVARMQKMAEHRAIIYNVLANAI